MGRPRRHLYLRLLDLERVQFFPEASQWHLALRLIPFHRRSENKRSPLGSAAVRFQSTFAKYLFFRHHNLPFWLCPAPPKAGHSLVKLLGGRKHRRQCRLLKVRQFPPAYNLCKLRSEEIAG